MMNPNTKNITDDETQQKQSNDQSSQNQSQSTGTLGGEASSHDAVATTRDVTEEDIFIDDTATGDSYDVDEDLP